MHNKQRVWSFFAHSSIIVGMMFVVFFIIDRFNPAMEFLTSSLSRWLILVLASCAFINGFFAAVFLFQKQKRRDEKRSQPHAQSYYEPEHMTQARRIQPGYDNRGYPRAPVQRGGSIPPMERRIPYQVRPVEPPARSRHENHYQQGY